MHFLIDLRVCSNDIHSAKVIPTLESNFHVKTELDNIFFSMEMNITH